MSSPGQRRGSCGHVIVSFNGHSFCAHCRDKGKGEEPCIANKEASDCKFCNALTPEQHTQLATLSYKLKKEKCEAKRSDSNAKVAVIGVVGDSSVSQVDSAPPEKKPKKDKIPLKSKKSVDTSATDSKISELDQKWLERFNRIEALLLSKSLQPTFSSEVHVSPTHSPPAGISEDSEPFFQPSHQPMDSSPDKCTGPDTHTALQWLAGKLRTDKTGQGQATSERTGPDTHALQHKSAGKVKSDSHQPRPSSSGHTGPDIAEKPQLTGKPSSDRHQGDSLPSDSDPASSKLQSSSKLLSNRPRTDQPGSSFLAGSELPPLQHCDRHDSISSLDSQAESDISDQPPVQLFVEEGELSEDQDFGESEQPTSEEQTYRETMSGIHFFMGWTHMPDMDSSNPSDDNPFAGPKAPVPNKVSVQMLTEEWLCWANLI